ncbi:MAG: hypothetical protein ACOX4F_08760 [Atopobiaceae bacterium]
MIGPENAYAATIGETIVANPENSFDLHLQGQYFSADAQNVLDYINNERKEATDNGYFGYHADQYTALQWNQGLETLARARAAEASVYPIHSRTTGENPSTSTWGENLAWYSTSSLTNIKLLMSEKNYYLQNKDTIYKDMTKVSSTDMEKNWSLLQFYRSAVALRGRGYL